MRHYLFLSVLAAGLSACSAYDSSTTHGARYGAQYGTATHGSHAYAPHAQGAYNHTVRPQTYGYYQGHAQRHSQGHYRTPTAQMYSHGQPRAPHYPLGSYTVPDGPELRGRQLASDHTGYYYGTLGVVNYDTDVESYGIEGRLGYQMTKNYGFEVEGSVGAKDEEETRTVLGNTVDISTGFDYNAALFFIGRRPVSERLAVHARVGYDARRLTVEGQDSFGDTAEATEDFNGFAYGIGGEYAFSKENRLRLDFTSYENEIGAAESISASFKRRF